jgi:hypothetical protein
MKQIEVTGRSGKLPSPADIERAVQYCNLRITLKGTLKQFAGCIHWHLKKGSERGTLELTLWPEQQRLWVTIQEGRKAGWIAAAAHSLIDALKGKQ